MLTGECHRTPLMISQHWLRYRLGTIRQNAITWPNDDPDLCHHIDGLVQKRRNSIANALELRLLCINSLAPGEFEWNHRHVIFKQILVIDGWGISSEIALIWMTLDFADDQSTLVQVMTWCRQATSHSLSQCWPISMSPNGVTRPQWVNSLIKLPFFKEKWIIKCHLQTTSHLVHT